MAQQAATGGETVMDQHGPHGRLPKAVPLKKYPEIVFDDEKTRESATGYHTSSKLDGNDTTNTYVQAGYTISTDSVYQDRQVYRAFSTGGGKSTTGTHVWSSEDNSGNGYNLTTGDPVSGVTFQDENSTSYTGHYIKLELPKKIKLNSISFKSQKSDYNSTNNDKRPTSGTFLGSNDGINWTLLKTFNEGELIWSGGLAPGETTEYLYSTSLNNIVNNGYFSYILFVIETIVNDNEYGPTEVRDLEYYGYEEDPPLGDTSVDTTFTSIMNTPQTTGVQVYVDGSLGETFTNRVVGPTVSNTHTTYVSAEKYWELSGNVESNVTLEANTFLSGDAPHSLSMWFKSSNLVSNASNSCIFSLGTEERLDHVSAAFSNNYQTVQKLLASDLEGNDRFGKDVAMNSDGTKVIVSAYLEHAGGTSDAGSAYIYTYNGVSWVEHKLVSPDNETSAQFGTSVSMSSDGMKVIVGAMHDDEGATDTGAAYIFTYSGGSWDAGTKIVAPDKAQDDRFGNSVGMSGDGTKVIVGAYIEDEDVAGGTTLTSAGSAYIFTYNGSSWDTGTKIVASDRAGSDLFGRSVAMNSDGTKAIVGAEGGEAAYIFTYNGSSWVEQQILVASDADAGDKFGFDVAMSGDGTKVIVGAYLEHAGNLSDAGAAYIYTYNGSSWDTGTKIVAPDKEAGDRFGYNVGMSSDGTGVIVGAYLEHAGVLTDTGSAYIYTYDGSNWDTGLKISAPVGDRTANDQFGSSVAMNSDGKKVIVGALLADPNSLSSAGFAHVFTRDTTHHLTTDLKLQSNTWHNLTYAYQGEGGSRVTYLDGRKVAEDQAEDTFGDYPPFAMTGYSQGGYVASASSKYDNTVLEYRVFDGSYTNAGAWISGADGYDTNGIADNGNGNDFLSGIVGVGSENGAWIKLQMPHKIVLSYLNFYVRDPSSGYHRQPKSGYIYGSNDDSSFDRIGTFTRTTTTAASTPIAVNINATTAYKYIVFQVTATITGGTEWDAVIVDEIELYGHRENDLVRLPDPTNVLKYPHVAMTGPAQRGYVVSASDFHSTNHYAWEAFNKVFYLAPANDGWVSPAAGINYYSGGSGAYTAGRNLGTGAVDGEWIKLELPHKIFMTQLKLHGFGDQPNATPTDFKVYGSNNDSNWVEVLSETGVTVARDTTGSLYTADDTTTAYKYFGLVVTRTAANSNYVGIQEIEYLGTGVGSIPLQIGGGNIDKVANFRVYDKFVGEDQALEIWDAQKDEFGRAKSSMTLHKGRLGIGTTEPEGRLAVADEPHNLEEFPPRAMTDYKTYFEGHGEFCVSASSEYGSDFRSWRLFDHARAEISGDDAWYTANGTFYNGTDNSYSGTSQLASGVPLGDYMKLKLPYRVNVKEFVLTGPNTESEFPRDFTFYGSNDNNIWNSLLSVTGVVLGTNSTATRSGVGDTLNYLINSSTFYKYYAIVITKGNSFRNTYVGIGEWRLFGTREQGQSVLHDGQLTLTKSLNVPRIGPALDADDTPRRDRLVVEYNTSTNPTFEGAVRDTSGRGNDGVFVGGASYDANEKALVFDGTDDYTRSGILTNMSGDKAVSYSLWIKADTLVNTMIVSLGKAGVYGTNGKTGGIFMENNGTLYNTVYGNGIQVSGAITIGTWIHIVATKIPGGSGTSTQTLYVNGVKPTQSNWGTTGTSLSLDDPVITLGASPTISQRFNGSISNFKLYDTALTAEEVKTLYDMGRCDEGHHVVNFSKTRVGIGLGDGEAPTYTLDVRGQIRSQGSLVTSFTGQHKCIPDEPMEKGLIVSAKKNQFVKLNGLAIGKSAITIDESLPIVSLSNVAQDKACFGVVSSIEEANTTFRVETTNGGVISTIPKTLGDNRAIVNSVGEGAIWVVNTGGSLESGDYITTSNVVGYGQKQDDDVLHNYTVAKITMDCDFTASNVAVQTIKREETGLQTIMEDTWNQLVEYDRSSNTETQYSNTLAPSAYTDQPGYTPREVTTIVDYTDGSNLVSIAEWSNLESNIQNTYQSNTFTEIVDYTKFVNLSEWSNLTTDVQNTYSEAEITTYYQIQRGENVLDENGQLQFEDKTGATEAPYERRFLDASGAQTDSANAVHIAAFVGCTYHCG
jgi:hypothetical protein